MYENSYYQINRQEIPQKAKQRYSAEKAAQYYSKNKEAVKEKSKNRYKNLSKEEKDTIKGYQGKRYQLTNLFITKEKHYKKNEFFFTQ